MTREEEAIQITMEQFIHDCGLEQEDEVAMTWFRARCHYLQAELLSEREKNKEMEERTENVKSVAIKNALICLSTEPVWAQKRIKALRDTIKQIGDKELTRRLLETDALGSFGGFLEFLEEEKMELFRKMILARLSPHPPEKEEQG